MNTTELKKLAEAYADAVAAHRLESLYGTSKSYTLEKARERDEAHEALVAAIDAQGVPDGWQLVPKEPTPEMLDAGRNACNGNMYPQDMLHGPRSMMADRWFAALASAPPAPHAEQHPDDMAVERFAAAMKDKLATARQKGRGGWEYCDVGVLSGMLREHVEKGDPRDVANFCMFLWSLGHGIAPQASVVQQEPIYQYQLADGAWVDQIEDSYKYNQAHGAKNIRIVYTHPVQRTKPQPLSDERALEIFNDLEKFMDQIEEEDISDERLAGKSMQFILDRIAAMKGTP